TGDLRGGDAQETSRRGCVHILAVFISRQQRLVLGDDGGKAKFDLAVIRFDDTPPLVRGDTAAIGRTPGQILYIGLRTAHTTSLGAELQVVGMHAARETMDRL